MQDKALIDDDAVRIASIGDAAQVLIGKVVGKGKVRTELLEPGLTFGAGAVGIDHAADGSEVACLELRNGGADAGDSADDLVTRNAWVYRRHRVAPFIASLVEVGVADTAEQDFDLDVVFGQVPACDRRGLQRRCCAAG